MLQTETYLTFLSFSSLLFSSLLFSSPLTVDKMTEGKTLTLRNAKIEMYRGCIRLIVDKWGLVEEETGGEDFQPKVNKKILILREKDGSEIDSF